MNEAGLIREQRQLLRTYCEAISARNLVEVDAEEQRKAAREVADVALTQLRYSADLQIATARKALEDVRVALLGANQSELLEGVHVAPTAALRNTDPAECLAQAVAAAASAQGSILDAVGVLARWHHQQTMHRRWQMLLGALAVIGVIVILVVMTTAAAQVEQRAAEQRATATRQAAAATHQALVLATVEADRVLIPAGEFIMGSADSDRTASDNEKPRHKVNLNAFEIDRTEVTIDRYAACVEALVCRAPELVSSSISASYYGDSRYGNYPVTLISWDDAQAYCQWSGGRLPTEAEWEKAARGTDGRVYPWGDALPDCTRANFKDCGGYLWAVGSRSAGASPYGALDMAGNVSEWVMDTYDNGNYLEPNLVEGFRTLRGGSCSDRSYDVRVARRDGRGTMYNDGSPSIGFRCVRSR